MTDLPIILPNFPTRQYTHLIPALDRHGVTVADLLSLDPLEIAKRASLPILDLRRLAQEIVLALQTDVGIGNVAHRTGEGLPSAIRESHTKADPRSDTDWVKKWDTISILDAVLDQAIGGGIPTGYVTEFTGESAAGKTQFLLSLLLSVQLAPPLGLSQNAIYISSEAPLSTRRLAQLLELHPRLSSLPAAEKPSLSRVLAIPVQDLESQDHILAFQLPNAIRKYHVGLVVLDSVAANYRAEHGSTFPGDLANRAVQLAKLGKLLRDLARTEKIAIVVANQVSDRFEELNVMVGRDHQRSTSPLLSSSPAPSSTDGAPPPPSSSENLEGGFREPVLGLDFQQRFFSGWGDEMHGRSSEGLKTPALGLGWTNQIACRIALKMEAGQADWCLSDEIVPPHPEGNIWKDRRKRRFLRLAFAPWASPTTEAVEYEIKPEGLVAVIPEIPPP